MRRAGVPAKPGTAGFIAGVSTTAAEARNSDSRPDALTRPSKAGFAFLGLRFSENRETNRGEPLAAIRPACQVFADSSRVLNGRAALTARRKDMGQFRGRLESRKRHYGFLYAKVRNAT
jgi:hypothetical protein